MNRFQRWWPLLVLALAPLWPLWRVIFLGEGIGPWDHVRAMAPWNGPPPSQPWDVLQADGVLQFAPWRYMVLDAWGKGQMPFWNPHELMGTPLLANSQSAGFYPPHIVMGLLHVPVYPAMAFLAWLHLFWAGVGVFKLSRKLGASRTGGTLAGVSFALSPFMLAWTPLPSVISTVAWLPWCLAALLGLFRQPRIVMPYILQGPSPASAFRVHDRADRARSTVALGVGMAMMCLAGHLQFLAYGLLAIALAGLVLAIFSRSLSPETRFGASRSPGDPDAIDCGTVEENDKFPKRQIWLYSGSFRGMVSAAFALTIGFCLAAPQLLPVLRFSKSSHRQQSPGAAGYRAYLGGAVSIFQVAGLSHPTVLGHPAEPSELIQGANSYWPALAKPGADFAESAITVGPLVLALLTLLRVKDWKRPEVLAVAAVGVLGVLIALGTPFNALLYYCVPGWSATGSPGRAGFLFVLCACVLAGLALTRLHEAARQRDCIPRAVALIFGLLAALIPMLAVSSLPDPYRLGPALATAVSAALLSALPWVLAALAAAALAVLLRPASRRHGALQLAAGLAVPILMLNGRTPILSGPPIDPGTRMSSERVAVVNRSWELVTSRPALLPPDTASLMGLVEVGGYDSLVDRDTKALLDGANGQDSAPPTNGNMMLVKPTADWARLSELGVSQVWSISPLPGMPSRVVPQDGVFHYVLGGPGRAASYSMPAVVTEDGYDHTSVLVYGGAPLVLRDRNLPGWTATVDGKSAAIEAAGPFRRVRLQRGDHTVVFHYWPPGLTAGLWLLALGCAALIPVALAMRAPKRIG